MNDYQIYLLKRVNFQSHIFVVVIVVIYPPSQQETRTLKAYLMHLNVMPSGHLQALIFDGKGHIVHICNTLMALTNSSF